MRVLIAGCGYVGIALGTRLLATGHQVAGIRRSTNGAACLREAGIEPWIVDLSAAQQLASLPVDWDWVVHCAAPSESTESAYRATYLESARNLVHRLAAQPPRAFVFTGSTSVYPQEDGSIVTETSETAPSTPLVRVLLETESLLLDAARRGFPARLLRVAGIYGPGRNRLDSLRRGEVKRSSDPTRFLNFIHRDDLAGAIESVLERGRNGDIYNVSDGHPVREGDLLDALAKALGIATPAPAVPRANGPPPEGRGRPLTNKRLDSSKLRRELGWYPSYPTFREGYEALGIPAGRL
ncbi:MAG: SDR family oxidoreductase [Verrucomicrobiales bacterium]|nr:SDR family oxidoreductase [Verrucomicrobiales bacterium]